MDHTHPHERQFTHVWHLVTRRLAGKRAYAVSPIRIVNRGAALIARQKIGAGR
jgi:hypothetical protein